MRPKIIAKFIAPKFWLTWVALLALRLVITLPFSMQVALGKVLGYLMYLVASERKKITQKNLSLCFPDLKESALAKLSLDVFCNNGVGIIETANAWWAPQSNFRGKVTIQGTEHLNDALDKGRGVILLGAHFSTLDIGGLLFSQFYPLNTMYRPHNNELMELIIAKGRLRFVNSLIDRHDFRGVIKALKKNEIVWYAPDQDFGPRNSVYANFFNQSAATVTATARLAKLSKSPIILLSHHREKDNTYTLRLHESVTPFPLEDDIESATRINSEIEKAIMYDPSQYMWMHRRFKTHPLGKGYVYKSDLK